MTNLKTKLQCLGLATALASLFAYGSYLKVEGEEDLTNRIKSGELVLFCNTNGYYKEIPVEKFVKAKEFKEGVTTFIFTNGKAKQCYVEKAK